MTDGVPDLQRLEERLAYLERQNRLLRRAVAVLFALVGISLLIQQIYGRQHRHQTQPPPKTAPEKPGD